MNASNSQLQHGLKYCHHCGLLMSRNTDRCPDCGSRCHLRKPYSLQNTIAWLITSILLYIPANTVPVMTTYHFGEPSHNTILSGVIYLWEKGSYLISTVIFLASIVVPLGKIITLSYLCISVYRKDVTALKAKTRAYEITELLGKWSMIDVFVVLTLVTLVQLGHTIAIQSNVGILAFAGVVICTMLAAKSFDPRLLWDLQPDFSSEDL